MKVKVTQTDIKEEKQVLGASEEEKEESNSTLPLIIISIITFIGIIIGTIIYNKKRD